MSKLLVAVLLFVIPISSQTNFPNSEPAAVVSVEIRSGASIYRVDGHRVEERKGNSLLLQLSRAVARRHENGEIFLVIDKRARISEIGKLNTAVDKVGAKNARRVFIADFDQKLMSEVSISEASVPLVLH